MRFRDLKAAGPFGPANSVTVRLLTPCHSAKCALIPCFRRVVKGIQGSWTIRLAFLGPGHCLTTLRF
jgi:hypothetical protein